MPNFCIKYSYTCNDVVYHKTAIVRAINSECAKNKVINFYRSDHRSTTVDSFAFEKISVSSFNLILI